MKKTGLMALPVLALAAVATIAAAYPVLDTENMTQEEKDLRIQMLELRQELTNDQIAYLNGEITEEQLEEKLQAHRKEAEPLYEQLREMNGNEEGDCRGRMGRRHMGFGPGMMGEI